MRTIAATVGICAALLACSPSPDSSADTTSIPPSHARQAPGLACLDSSVAGVPVAFGVIHKSPETEDASGVQFAFTRVGETLTGSVRDARGETPPPRPLRDVRYDAATDSVAFWYDTGGQTRYIYRVRLSCERLTGTALLFVTESSPGSPVVVDLPRAPVITAP